MIYILTYNILKEVERSIYLYSMFLYKLNKNQVGKKNRITKEQNNVSRRQIRETGWEGRDGVGVGNRGPTRSLIRRCYYYHLGVLGKPNRGDDKDKMSATLSESLLPVHCISSGASVIYRHPSKYGYRESTCQAQVVGTGQMKSLVYK